MPIDLSQIKPFFDAQDSFYYSALLDNDAVAVKMCLEGGSNPNEMMICSASVTDVKIAPPLCVAAAAGNLETIELLCQYGGDVNKSDDCGITPLMLAAGNGYSKIVKFLVEKGADLTAIDDEGIPVIDYPSDERIMVYLTYKRVEQIAPALVVKKARARIRKKQRTRE